MSVYRWEEVDGDSGDFGQKNSREATRHFVAETTDRHDGMGVILTYPNCPKPYEGHPDYPLEMFVKSVQPTRRKKATGRIWDTIVRYSSDIDREEDDDPLSRPPKVTMQSQKVTRPVFVWADGTPILNAAGDRIVGVERTFTDFIFNITKEVASYPRWLLDFPDAVNSDVVKIKGLTCPVGTLKFEGLSLGEENETPEGVVHLPVGMQLYYRKDTWKERLLNQGVNELVERKITQDGKAVTLIEKVPILIKGERTTELQFLDTDGRRPRYTDGEHKGEVKEKLEPSDLVVIEGDTYDQKPFSVLPLK